MTKRREFPRSACAMPLGSAAYRIKLEGGRETDGATARKFSMVINTGKVMEHPFWGKFAIDLSGVAPATKRTPTLLDHDQTKRVGFTEAGPYEITDLGLEPPGGEGTLLRDSSAYAQEIVAQSLEGFPFQASPFIEPTVLEEVLDGGEAEVNGATLAGPAIIFRQSRILENSFVSVGADDDTVASALSRSDAVRTAEVLEQETEMNQDPQTSADETTEETPVETTAEETTEEETTEEETTSDVEPDVVAMERARSSAILDTAAPAQATLARTLIEEGVPLVDALTRLAKDATRRLAGMTADSDEPLGVGDGEETPAVEPGRDPVAQLQKQWNAKTQEGAALRADFTDFDEFKAFELAKAAGRIRIFSRQQQN